jgi:hypothetical protein
MKTINIRIYLQGIKGENDKGEITIDTDAVSKDILQAFEFMGVYEFIKKEFRNEYASVLLMRIEYTETGLRIRKKVFKNKLLPRFQISDALDKMIEDEMKTIKNKINFFKALGPQND